MRTQRFRSPGRHLAVVVWVAALTLTGLASVTRVPTQQRRGDDLARALLLSFDLPGPKETPALSAEVLQSLDVYRSRLQGFKPSFEVKGEPGRPEHSLQLKRIALERTLVGLFDTPGIETLAYEYARRARLSYEWEGFAEGPLSDASVADAFLEQNPASPIAPYANLFAGHRKMCAVSGLEGLDPFSAKAREIAEAAAAQLHLARSSAHPLISFVAEHLLETRRCFGDG